MLPPEMQVEVLYFVEFLLLRFKKQSVIERPKPTFGFIVKGNSDGIISQITDLRDFAYED